MGILIYLKNSFSAPIVYYMLLFITQMNFDKIKNVKNIQYGKYTIYNTYNKYIHTTHYINNLGNKH